VPRATFANVQRAVEAWTTRAGTHRGNLLLLFVASHGESFGRRTAILLEDYGSVEKRVTAGMTEIEQFVDALAEIESENQLLIFDCCRMPTPLRLRYDQQFGSTLVDPPAREGLPRRPYVLRSTALGAEAFGRKNRPTLFTQALLDALKGLAASPNDRWAIDNYKLADIAARLLGLHLRDGVPLQEPDSQISRRFLVSVAPPTETATVFVSLTSDYDFVGSRIRVMDGQALVTEVTGSKDEPPFARLQIPKYLPRTIAALDASGKVIGQTRIEPLPPVAFAELPERFSLARRGASKGVRVGKGCIVLSVSGSTPSPANAVASVRRCGDSSGPTRIALMADAAETTLEVDPGWYAIDLATADGRLLSAEVEVKSGAKVEANLDLSALARDWRPDAAAVATAVIALDESTSRAWLAAQGAPESKFVAGGEGDDHVLLAPIPPPSSLLSVPREGADRRVAEALTIAAANGTGIAFGIVDQEAQRLGSRTSAQPQRPSDWPAWVAVAGPGWREIAAVPSLGVAGRFQYDAAGRKDPWVPVLRVEPRPRAASSQVEIHAPTRQWSGLLAFLGLRDFERSAVVLDGLLAQTGIRTALLDKIENPLTAIASSLVAVATRRLEAARIPEQWFSNLTTRFPGLPDGPVIRARLLLSRPDFASRRAEAKALLLDACRRGVPVYSLAVDWLAQGLGLFADDPDAAKPARNAGFLAQLVDPTRTFTVLRIPAEVET
jgi:Caspase domain